jgi:hypothetical protein
MNDIDYSRTHMRQLDLIPEEFLTASVHIIGVGGIGSITAYTLAKMGLKNITIQDFDKVEEHNISTQMYGLQDIGKFKVEALAERIKNDIGTKVKVINKKADKVPDKDIVIFALDSMDERIKLWNSVKESDSKPQNIIDARMGLEFIRVYSFSMFSTDSIEAYEKNLYPSSESEQLSCTARAVVYNTFFISSIISSEVKKMILSQEPDFEILGDISVPGIRKSKGKVKGESKGKVKE